MAAECLVSYPSDLSDEEWARLEPCFARSDPRGARAKYPTADFRMAERW